MHLIAVSAENKADKAAPPPATISQKPGSASITSPLSQKGAPVRRRVGYTLRCFPKYEIVELRYARDSHNRSQQSRPLPIVLLFGYPQSPAWSSAP